MITLADLAPGTPDIRTPNRYLVWLARRQWRTLVGGLVFGVAWMLAQAALPAVVGRTVDAGVVRRDVGALAVGTATVLGLAVVQAVTGVMRHRLAVANWMQAALRTNRLIGSHVAEEGLAVAATTTTGEAVSTAANDAPRLGDVFDITPRLAGAVAAYLIVSAVVLRTDVLLGSFVLIGVPVLSAAMTLVVRPLHARQAAQRESEGRLLALGADTVAGLRVLRGIGGEAQFLRRYRDRSQQVRRAGTRVAAPQASLDTTYVLLPGIFVVTLTWLGARATVSGRITPGELVTLYGYAAFLALPLGTASEALGKLVRGRVAATRVTRLLRLHRDQGGAGASVQPRPGALVADPASGLVLPRGAVTALVSASTAQAAAVADRLVRLDGAEPNGADPAIASPTIGEVPVSRLPVDVVRSTILLSEAEPRLFSGTLREEIDPSGEHDDAAVLRMVHVAAAEDVLEALPEGLDAQVEERGRGFSGGQRQRLVLARALLADPEVLVLVEPTSAVDAHTEARIAARLRAGRAGRTTLITTSSPLLLDHADRVAFLEGGRVVAEGTHRELLHTVPAYRDTVTRGEDG